MFYKTSSEGCIHGYSEYFCAYRAMCKIGVFSVPRKRATPSKGSNTYCFSGSTYVQCVEQLIEIAVNNEFIWVSDNGEDLCVTSWFVYESGRTARYYGNMYLNPIFHLARPHRDHHDPVSRYYVAMRKIERYVPIDI